MLKKIIVTLIVFMLTTPATASQTPSDAKIETINCTKQFYEQRGVLREKLGELRSYVLESYAEMDELYKLAPKLEELREFYLNSRQHTLNSMVAAFIALTDSIVHDAETAGCYKIIGVVQGVKSSIQNLPDLREK